MSLKRAILAAVFSAAASGTIAAAPAPSPSPSPAQDRIRAALSADIGPMPSDAAVLNGYVTREDWTPLIKRLGPTTAPSEVLLDLNWERSKVVNGGNFLFDIVYVNTLWKTANSLPEPAADQLRQTAVAFALYGLALVDLDGPRCKDPTAPARKVQQAMTNWAVIIRYGQSLPPQQQEVVKQVALKLEWATAPVRANDPVLCRGGMAEMQANLAAGAKPREAPTAPSPNTLPGKTYDVPNVVDYKPEYLAEALWKPIVDARRAKLAETFASVLKAPTPAG
ncbi:MAG TPA: hypothetical protein VFE18_08080 [Phenylobacterium sp.]|jgi:hypothetical protein|uniref:hypothetical protein n=1 Tax=Phenylobacterium sp. TaxID=1871053 RepID=UPI002D625BB9|nr:hypothetical protein [Phenylobacterium sp.]HZZ68118.1 hypothetical protein [Phenylobacterium sp.]